MQNNKRYVSHRQMLINPLFPPLFSLKAENVFKTHNNQNYVIVFFLKGSFSKPEFTAVHFSHYGPSAS